MRRRLAEVGVHPRVCGEHSRYARIQYYNAGSSPRMRGAQAGGAADHAGVRFIPAYAGSTKHVKTLALLSRVHPRVCGEHLLTSAYQLPL